MDKTPELSLFSFTMSEDGCGREEWLARFHPQLGKTARCVSLSWQSRGWGTEPGGCPADPAMAQIIAKYSGNKPWQPLDIALPRFFFSFRGDNALNQWGYRFTVRYGGENFELGIEFLEAGARLPSPVLVLILPWVLELASIWDPKPLPRRQ